MKKNKLTHLDKIVIQDFSTQLLLSMMRQIDANEQKYLDFDIYLINLLTEVLCKIEHTKVVYDDYTKYQVDPEKCIGFIHKVINNKFYKNLIVEHRSLTQVIDTTFNDYTKTHLPTLIDIFMKECRRADEDVATSFKPNTH